jgi:glycosyltransferase involved in cell wall biosynthesis
VADVRRRSRYLIPYAEHRLKKVMEVVASLAVGGAERVALELAAGLNATEHLGIRAELAVVGGADLSAGYERSILGEAQKRGVPVQEVRASSASDPDWSGRFCAVVAERGIDLVHVHNRPRDWQIVRLCALMGVPVIYTVHKPYTHDHLRTRLLYAALGRIVNPVVCVSRTVADHVHELEFIPSSHLRVIYNGVNMRVFAPPSAEVRLSKRESLGWFATDFIWLCAARFHPQKAHQFLLEAMARLPDSSRSRLILAGEGPLEGELRRITERLRLSSRVAFLGPRSDVPELLGAADAYVMSSREEGHPLSLLEAMACQLPILAPRLPSITEIATANAPCFFGPTIRGIARSHDPTHIAEAMMAMETSPGAARSAAATTREHVAAKFSLEAMIGQHAELYQSVLGRPPGLGLKALRLLGTAMGYDRPLIGSGGKSFPPDK